MNEASYINYLTSLDPGVGDTPLPPPPDWDASTDQTYNRIGSNLLDPVGGWPKATATGAFKDEQGGYTDIDVTGWTYVLAKYDASRAGAYVWYVAGLSDVDLPATAGTCGSEGCGLSHYSMFNPTAAPVPEPATLLLLGSGVIGLAAYRRTRG